MCLNYLKPYVCASEIEYANSLMSSLQALRIDRDKLQATLDTMDSTKKELANKVVFLQSEMDKDDASIANLLIQINNLQTTGAQKDQSLSDLTAQLNKYTNTEEIQFNNDYPKTQEHYQKRYIFDEYGKKAYLDMYPQEYIVEEGYLLNEAKGRIFNKYHPATENDIVRACGVALGADDVLAEIYRSDDYFGTPMNDFWQYPQETIVLKKGDCEDLAILWKSLCDKCGVPPYKTRVHLGEYGTTGHAYGAYKPTLQSKELLIEATQRYPRYSDSLTTLESHPEYVSYYAFNNKLMWKIRDGISFGKLVERIKLPRTRRT